MSDKESLAGVLIKPEAGRVLVKGFRLFDRVEYRGNKGFIFARRVKGGFILRNLQGGSISE